MGDEIQDDDQQVRNIPQYFLQFVAREPSLALSLTYVLMIGVGMLFSYQYYASWGLDIFQFAGFEDFLLAPFKDMLVVFFLLLSVFGAYLAFRFSIWSDKKFPRLAKYWNFGITTNSSSYLLYQGFGLIAGILIYLYLSSQAFAMYRERKIKRHPEEFRVEVHTDGSLPQAFLLLGTTEHFVLVLSEKDKQVQALPLESGAVRAIRLLKSSKH